jgi:hypothetical protein
LAELFREQSTPWRGIAESYIQDILTATTKWIDLALEQIASEEGLRAHVSAILQEWVEEAEKSAQWELERILQDERRGPITFNRYYTDNVQRSRSSAQEKEMRSHSFLLTAISKSGSHTSSVSSSSIDTFISTVTSRTVVDMDQYTCDEAKIHLNAYYKVSGIISQRHGMLTDIQVAMKTFVDNIARQVVERHIVAPLPEAFCPLSVSRMSDEDLLQIGSEPKNQVERREKLMAAAHGLKKSLKELQRPV